jgi:hypothetical protein
MIIMSKIVQVRRNSESAEWTDVPLFGAEDVPDLNLSYGWEKFRAVDEPTDAEVTDAYGPSFLLFDALMAYENGTLDEEGMLDLFQGLVSTGLAWQLQGSYGRMAAQLLDAGLISAPEGSAQ